MCSSQNDLSLQFLATFLFSGQIQFLAILYIHKFMFDSTKGKIPCLSKNFYLIFPKFDDLVVPTPPKKASWDYEILRWDCEIPN